MCSEPNISYGPIYKSFIFGDENEAMKKAKAEDFSDENDRIKNGSDESKARNRRGDKKGKMEFELPELVVFLQESNYDFVKDICVDKKMHSQGTCLVENCELDHKIISCIIESHIEPEPKADEESKNRLTKSQWFDSPDEKSTKEIVPESLHKVAEVHKAVSTISEDDNTQIVTENGKTGCNSENRSMSTNLDESTSQQVYRNSSLFGSGHFSGLISQHGSSTPSFRSLSHRSNSSTTSSRSFAFPVLASEWHGSPEKMVKPEKREPKKKNKSKCARFLCCNLKVFE